MAAKKKIRVKLDLKRWLRGEYGNSYLLRSIDKKMCCVGFLASGRGVGDKSMSDRTMVTELSDRAAAKMPVGGYRALYRINDAKTGGIARRIAALNVEAAKLDPPVEFYI